MILSKVTTMRDIYILNVVLLVTNSMLFLILVYKSCNLSRIKKMSKESNQRKKKNMTGRNMSQAKESAEKNNPHVLSQPSNLSAEKDDKKMSLSMHDMTKAESAQKHNADTRPRSSDLSIEKDNSEKTSLSEPGVMGAEAETTVDESKTAALVLPNEPTEKPDIYIQDIPKNMVDSPWNVVGVSVQGSGHIKSGLPCQDAHGYKIVEDKAVVVAVADGLGSAAQSHQGSKIAVDTAIEVIQRLLFHTIPSDKDSWEKIMREGFEKARLTLESSAKTANCAIREYGTTLIVVVITEEWIATGHIGDGAAVGLFDNDKMAVVCMPQNTEYANQTFPLTGSNALEIAYFQAAQKKIKAMSLFSDGLQHLSINNKSQKPYEPFFIPFFEPLATMLDARGGAEKLAEFLASKRVCDKTDDDKTLLLVGRKQTED